MNIDKALEAEQGFLVSSGPFYTGGTASPVGLDLPTSTFYLQTTASGVLVWRKFNTGVNDWRQLSAQDILFNPVTNIIATNIQGAIETHGLRHNPNGPDAVSTATASNIGTNTVNAEGSASSLSRSDHTHKVSLPSQHVYSATSTTTTSASDTVINTMTITPGAGTYLILFNMSLDSSANNSQVTTSLYANNAQIADTEITIIPRASNQSTVRPLASNIGTATVANGQAIDARWRRTAGTITGYNRRLQLLRIS